MKSIAYFMGSFFLFAMVLVQGGYLDSWQDTAQKVNSYESKSYALLKENQKLKAEIGNLNYKVQTLEAKNSFLEINLTKDKSTARTIASVMPVLKVKNDLVKHDVYKWNSKQLVNIANTEFQNKNYELFWM